MDHQSPHPPKHDQHQEHGRFLDLDGEVFADSLAAVLDLIGPAAVRSIVDLGAGSGAGSRLLRQRYPDAVVRCVDNDPEMIARLREQGFAVVEADLDDGFPAAAGPGGAGDHGIDLVWASSALHHLTQPARLLAGVRRALAPAGRLVVVELADLPSFLVGQRDVLLEQRCHSAAAAQGWNHHPDWAPAIEAAGLRVTTTEVTTEVPVTAAAADYARQWFLRFAHLELAPGDRAAVDDLLSRFPDGVALRPRVTRTVWTADRQS